MEQESSNLVLGMSDRSLRKILAEAQEDELAIFMAYSLSENARNALYYNMGAIFAKHLDDVVKRYEEVQTKFKTMLLDEARNDYTSSGIIVFTDMVNSTFTNSLFGDERYYTDILDVHNRIMQRHIGEHFGRTIKTIGDSYLLVFSGLRDAIEMCKGVQSGFAELNRKRTEEERIHVRTCIHQGEFKYKVARTNVTGSVTIDIFGMSVNYGARLLGITAGDMVYCSSSIIDRIREIVDESKATIESGRVEIDTDDEEARRETMGSVKKAFDYYSALRHEKAGTFSFKGFGETQQVYRILP